MRNPKTHYIMINFLLIGALIVFFFKKLYLFLIIPLLFLLRNYMKYKRICYELEISELMGNEKKNKLEILKNRYGE